MVNRARRTLSADADIKELARNAASDYRSAVEALGPAELLDFLAGYYYAMQRIDASRFPEDGRNDFEKQAMQRDRRERR